MKPVEKRFPANTTLDITTFLNDKKIDGELYAYLQSISVHDGVDTYVVKEKMPTQDEICKVIGVKSRTTYRTHLRYLIDQGLIIDYDGKYLLPLQENIYFLIPLTTLQFLIDNCKEHVIKIYIYLGQRWKWARIRGEAYNFTYKEIAKHIGILGKHEDIANRQIKNALILLKDTGLINYEEIYINKTPYKKLINFSFNYNK